MKLLAGDNKFHFVDNSFMLIQGIHHISLHYITICHTENIMSKGNMKNTEIHKRPGQKNKCLRQRTQSFIMPLENNILRKINQGYNAKENKNLFGFG